MFRLVHEMRVRIMTAPAFTGAKVIATILFEGTMDGEVKGKSAPAFLWEERGVIPFVKVDKGLEAEKDGVQLMRPMPELDALLTRAVKLGVFGTKMRSVINLASKDGIAAIVAQQFDVGAQIAKHGLMPILEPEVSIKSPDKAGAEAILLAELTRNLDAAPDGPPVMFKLTLPDVPDLYLPLTKHKRVARVVALSGGYTRAVACQRLSANHGMIASFSRALVEELKHSMSDAEFERPWQNQSTRFTGPRPSRFDPQGSGRRANGVEQGVGMPVEMIGWIAPRVSSELIPPSGPPFDAERDRRDGAHSRARRLRPRADRLFLGCAGRVPGRGARRGGDRAAEFPLGASPGVRGAAGRRPQARDSGPAQRWPSGGAHDRRRQRRRAGQGRRLDRT